MSDRAQRVGPVIDRGEVGSAVIAAIRALNRDVVIEDRGSYLRVLVPRRCVVTRRAVEAECGRRLTFPGDLEVVMPSFKGRFACSEEEASWSLEQEP